MKWLQKKIYNWVNSAYDTPSILVSTSDHSISSDNSIRFSVYNAKGGRVVETRMYDPRKGNSREQLYVITPEQDFGKEIDKIITMEYLK